MVANSTVHFIDMYVDEATPVPFLTSFFRAPPKNFYTSEKVSIDLVRDTEEIAIAIQDLSTGTRENELSLYQNKGFTPPIFDESATLTAYDMIKRFPGQDVFSDPDYLENATEQSFAIFRKLENKIRRAIELQCAQVLQTGKVNLVDKAGRPMFVLDYGPRTAHFPTVGVNWDSGSAVPLSDLATLGEAVRRNGKGVPGILIFGKRAWRDFFQNAAVQKLFDIRRYDFGSFKNVRQGGSSSKGMLTIDNYDYEIHVYDGTYLDPQTGNTVNYVDQDAVIMMSEASRLDLTFGAIPLLKKPDSPALSFLPPRISSGDAKLDLTVNAWFSPDGKHLKVSAGTRPLAIPTAIDTFGCLKTRI